MADFETNDRRQHEIACRPAIDAIYAAYWPGCKIERGNLMLDKYLAIDVNLTLPNGMTLSGQEKALRHEYRTFRTVTVEYWNDPITKHNPGAWFHMAAQFYFCGYANEECTAFNPWVILDWLQVIEATRRGRIQWGGRDNSKSNAGADFKYTPMEDLPRRTIIASQGLVFPAHRLGTFDLWTARECAEIVTMPIKAFTNWFYKNAKP